MEMTVEQMSRRGFCRKANEHFSTRFSVLYNVSASGVIFYLNFCFILKSVLRGKKLSAAWQPWYEICARNWMKLVGKQSVFQRMRMKYLKNFSRRVNNIWYTRKSKIQVACQFVKLHKFSIRACNFMQL